MAKSRKYRHKQEIPEETQPESPEPEAIKIECGLPKKDLFRVDEVARYFNVTDRTIRLWIEHGLLVAEKYKHQLRIPRREIINFRLASRVKHAETL